MDTLNDFVLRLDMQFDLYNGRIHGIFQLVIFMETKNMHRLLLKFRCMNKHNNMYFDLMSVNSETLVFIF
jgi:hypothetical protein